ncbi:MAG: sulfatase-like hydrolase/transferase, partial [Planctomycetota bacterium]
MLNYHHISRRIAWGAILFALFGIWSACARLPHELQLTTRLVSWGWSLILFAGAGIIICAFITGIATLLSEPVTTKRQPKIAAGIETLLFAPLILWLLLNEIVYSTTSQVVGPETLAMVWSNPAATFEAAWEMGAWYFIALAIVTLGAVIIIYRLSLRSFRSLHKTAPQPKPHTKLAGSMTGIIVILAGLLIWQFNSRPSRALTVVFRSIPHLRAFNLTRALVGIELTGPVPQSFGPPVISEEQYRAHMDSPRTPPPNVVFILLESVSAQALHCYDHQRSDITPNIDALAEQGILFEHCLSPASFSSYSIVSIMTSL